MSLQYNVSSLVQEPLGCTRQYEIDEHVLIGDHEARLQRVAGDAAFLRTKHGVLVTAHLQGVQHDLCSRCLKDADVPIQVDFEEEFFASVDARTGIALPAPEDPDAFRIDARHTLDLEEAVRQFWTGALPIQPLCRADCRGLCPRCGQDLNEAACACTQEEDARWSPLLQLAQKLEGK